MAGCAELRTILAILGSMLLSVLSGLAVWWLKIRLFDEPASDKKAIRLIILQLETIFKAWDPGRTTAGKGDETKSAISAIKELKTGLSKRPKISDFRKRLECFMETPHAGNGKDKYENIRTNAQALIEGAQEILAEKWYGVLCVKHIHRIGT